MKLLIISCIILYIPFSFAENDCPVSYHCNNTRLSQDNKITQFCKGTHGQISLSKRCCILNNTITGLDLRFCDIKNLNISLRDFSNVNILDMRENDFEKFTSENLIGLLKLDYLYLPAHIPCPGGKDGWNLTSGDNDTTTCEHQLNYCKSLNITCGDPDNADCHPTGPGSARCLCLPGYFGYKCLNKGVFPTTLFTTTVIIPTIIFSIALWFIIGRDPYKRIHIED